MHPIIISMDPLLIFGEGGVRGGSRMELKFNSGTGGGVDEDEDEIGDGDEEEEDMLILLF